MLGYEGGDTLRREGHYGVLPGNYLGECWLREALNFPFKGKSIRLRHLPSRLLSRACCCEDEKEGGTLSVET